MDNINTYNIEFIDLSDVEEQERNWILNSLHSWDPNVIVPWKKTVYQSAVKRAVHSLPLSHGRDNVQLTNNVPHNMVLTANVNVNDRSNVKPVSQQMYPIYNVTTAYPQQNKASLPHQEQSVYMNMPYQRPDSINVATTYSQQLPQQNVVATVVVNSDINYAFNNDNSKAYINTKVEITQDITNAVDSNTVPAVNNLPLTQTQLPVNNSTDRLQGQTVTNYVTKSLYNEVQQEKTYFDHYPSRENKIITENVPKSGNKSWASLFSHSNEPDSQQEGNVLEDITKPLAMISPFIQSTDDAVVNNNIDANNDELKVKSNYNDPVYYILGEHLCQHAIDHRTISLQPRGLINRSNYCYINSILQALLACPPVYNLLSGLSEKVTINSMKKFIPIIDNMSKFVCEFQHLPAGQRVSRRIDKNLKQDPNSLINCDTPFEPNYIYKMLNGMRSDTFVVEGRQEDAEEFLGCLLNGLNDEMLELMKLVETPTSKPVEIVNVESDVDKEWQVMGPKNKGCVTRRTTIIQTPISNIFSGHLRSRVHRTGDKSTDNIQPFFTLQLNIEKVTTVREALEALVCKNQLEGVTSSRTNEEVEAWQQVTIEELPYVLVLHLKCFDYKLDGCTKIIKALEFPIDLKIDSKLLSSKANYSPKEKQYKLFAIVYHDGKEASKGHYITDAYHVGFARWLRYDDASVKTVPEDQVLKPHGTRVPYLLFYRRSDSIRSK